MDSHAHSGIVRLAVLAAALVCQPAVASAQDAAKGRLIAERWCAPCHATASRGSDAAPSFERIAATPAAEPERMRRFLAAPHPPMPPLQLAHGEVEDLVAYVASLRAR